MNPKFSHLVIAPETPSETPRKRGKVGAQEAFAAMKKETAPVNFRLPAEKLAKFKARCAVNGDTMTSVFEQAMDAYLAKK